MGDEAKEQPGYKPTYFKGGGFVEKLLRFFSLLETDSMTLCWTHISTAASTMIMVYTTVFAPSSTAMLGAAGGLMAALGNMAHKRWMDGGK